jgi:hypothetical protein
MVVALAILSVALLPLAYGFSRERTLATSLYYRAVATEIVDGEVEVLQAGEWRAYPEGTQAYTVTAEAATNLPPGRFELVRSGKRLSLEWLPAGRWGGGRVRREIRLP